MSEGAGELFRDLVDLDVAQLLSRLRSDLSPGFSSQSPNKLANRFLAWQLANDLPCGETATAIRVVRGRPGYQSQAAEFGRRNMHRSVGLEEFRQGLGEESRRNVDRWGWAMEQYVRDVDSFAAREFARQRNVQLVRNAATTIVRAHESDLETIEKELKVRARGLQKTEDSITAGKILSRIIDVESSIDLVLSENERLVTERDNLLEQLRGEESMSTRIREINQRISLREQIRAFRQLVAEVDANWVDSRLTDILRLKRKELSSILALDASSDRISPLKGLAAMLSVKSS